MLNTMSRVVDFGNRYAASNKKTEHPSGPRVKKS